MKAIIMISAVILGGLLCGLELGAGLQHQSAQALPEASWTLMHQSEDSLFRKIIPPAFLLTILLMVISAVLSRGLSRTCFLAAAILTAAEVIATIILNVPINNQVQAWSAGHAPANWMSVRDAWLRNHWLRSIAGLVGFVASVVGLAKR